MAEKILGQLEAHGKMPNDGESPDFAIVVGAFGSLTTDAQMGLQGNLKVKYASLERMVPGGPLCKNKHPSNALIWFLLTAMAKNIADHDDQVGEMLRLINNATRMKQNQTDLFAELKSKGIPVTPEISGLIKQYAVSGDAADKKAIYEVDHALRPHGRR
jgi:hypothetical protein